MEVEMKEFSPLSAVSLGEKWTVDTPIIRSVNRKNGSGIKIQSDQEQLGLPASRSFRRGVSILPTSLYLLTSIIIIFYIYSTTNFFHRHHSTRRLLLTPPAAVSLEVHHNIQSFRPPTRKPPLPYSHKGGMKDNHHLINSKGKHGKTDVFHNKELFLKDYQEMKKSFKIYVYPHKAGDPFAKVLLPVDYDPSGNYASEGYFKKVLMQSHFITEDPSMADLFFLPFSIAGLRHDRRVNVGGIPDFVMNYMSHIRSEYPYWNRSGGADHFYVACHSVGRSAMAKAEDVKVNAIQVVCSSSYFLAGYVAHKDASLPQVWPRKGNPPGLASLNSRKKLAFFAGAINSGVRKYLVETWQNDSEMFIHSGRLRTPYADQLLSSKFCLHLKGYEVNTARIADSLFYGCVPVIIADHYDLPFADILDWRSFSLVVPSGDIPSLKKILQRAGLKEYERLQQNVLKVRKHFMWHRSPLDEDAFYMVMYQLWLRRSVVRIPLKAFSGDFNSLHTA